MILSNGPALALAALLIAHDQGSGVLDRQLPLHASDRGETILVKGTPYDDASRQVSASASYVLFRKSDAEILDFGTTGRMDVSPGVQRELRKVMPREAFERMVGPHPKFVPDPARPDFGMEAMRMIYGGLINGAGVARDYGAILLEATRRDPVDRETLRANEVAGVWHITRTASGKAEQAVSFERSNGRVLSAPP